MPLLRNLIHFLTVLRGLLADMFHLNAVHILDAAYIVLVLSRRIWEV